MSLQPDAAVYEALAGRSGMPTIELPDGTVVKRPSAEYLTHQLRWRWLLDSYEGGEAYRMAVYDYDLHGMPVRNLIRHKREYPSRTDAGYSPSTGRPVGTDQAAQATDDDYELRRARTPIPTFTEEVVSAHLANIYSQEIRRDGPEKLKSWWKDVDGCGATMDQWMGGTISPLLLVFGHLDLIVEHPPKPDGEELKTRADEIRLKLDTCVASYILPVNMMWWKVDRKDRYTACIVREIGDDGVRFRYWDAKSWTLYDGKGKKVEKDGHAVHSYGRVPIVRCFDQRRASCRFIGKPRYESIAELQREYYNRDSELILSDTTQAHPLLQGPEDFVKADGTIPVGPNWLLPKKKNTHGGAATYEGFDVVQFPKDGAESIRLNKSDIRDAVDRAACLTKPAGTAGTTGETVGQSGVSKRLDQTTGNKLLGNIAKTLQKAEETIAELACAVLGVPIDPDDNPVKVGYPTQFDLYDANEMMMMMQSYELIITQVGDVPEVEEPALNKIARLMLVGMDDKQYLKIDEAHAALLAQRGVEKRQQREAAPDPNTPPTDPNTDPAGSSTPDDQPDEGE